MNTENNHIIVGPRVQFSDSIVGITFENREQAIDALISKVFGARVTYSDQDGWCNDPDHDSICAERQESRCLRSEWNRLDGLRIENQKLIESLTAENNMLRSQRDSYNLLAGELIALIRVSVQRGAFNNVSTEELDAFLQPWIERRAEIPQYR
jgi:hypothetical protein